MAKDRRGKSPAFLKELRRKYGLGEFSRAARASRSSRGVSTPRARQKNAKKVPLRAKSKSRKTKKPVYPGLLRNSMNWGL